MCACDPQELHRLQVFSQAFEDVCSSSLLFGGILKEVKVSSTRPASWGAGGHLRLHGPGVSARQLRPEPRARLPERPAPRWL